MRRCLATLLLSFATGTSMAEAPSSTTQLSQRVYYFTFSRMPVYGLAEWKLILDCVKEDGGNTVILWIGGGFRSKRFPESWAYNIEHANIKDDFGKALIGHAHSNGIKVVLGLTPFGYGGVNQIYNSRPHWCATGPDGKPTTKFGFHSWGYNLCPSRNDTQQFMHEYARKLCVEFYPNADGIIIESSDYAVCYCQNCAGKFYDREFAFVQPLTGDIRKANRDAIVMVYPHYFSGAEAPGLGARGTFTR